MQRNYDTWGQLASANNSAWSEVALKPTETFAPKPPQMQSPNIIGGLLGMADGIVGAMGSGAGKPPGDAYPGLKGSNDWGNAFKTQLQIPSLNNNPVNFNPAGNSFNFNSYSYQN